MEKTQDRRSGRRTKTRVASEQHSRSRSPKRSVVMTSDRNSKTSLGTGTTKGNVSSSGSCRGENLRDSKDKESLEIRKPRRGRRKRFELLEKIVMFPDEFLRLMEDYGPNGPMNVCEKLKPIAIVLRPNEPCGKYEQNFQYWLKRREVTLSELHDDPEEERRYRQTFVYVRATTAIQKHWDRAGKERLMPRRRSRSRSSGRTRKRSVPRDSVQDSKNSKRAHLDSSVRSSSVSLEDKKHSDIEVQSPRSSSSVEQPSRDKHRAPGADLHLKELEDMVQHRFTQLERELRCLRSQTPVGVEMNSPSTTSITNCACQGTCTPEPTEEINTRSVDVIPNVVSTGPEHYVCADPVRMATEVLKKAAQVNADPAQKRLTKNYTRLSTQIVLNETAMKDSLAYVKSLRVSDEADVEAHLSQMKELKVCIESEKQRRDTALAAVVAQEWKEQRDEFEYLIRQVDQTDTPHASHEKLATIYNNLSQNGVAVLALRSKLKNRLSLLNVGDVGRDAECRELEVLSSNLAAARRDLC